MLENLTELLLPVLLLLAGAVGIAKKQDVYSGMLAGAQDGLRLILSLVPTLVLMLTAVTMLRESGFFAKENCDKITSTGPEGKEKVYGQETL